MVPLVIGEDWIKEIKERQPELRDEKMARYAKEYEIHEYDISILTGTKRLADIFEETTALCGKPKKVSNWLMVEAMRLLKEKGMDAEDISFSPKHLAELIELVEKKEISGTVAKEVFEVIFAEDIEPEIYVAEKGLKTVTDEAALRTTISGILEENSQSVAEYKAGKTKVLGFLTGQTMKAMKGKADPSVVNKILLELLS